MKLQKIKNSWAVEVTDIDFNDRISFDQIKQICDAVLSNTVVLIRNQKLTPERQVELCSMFGDIDLSPNPEKQKSIIVINGVARITGKKNEKGQPAGIFGHKETLDWHSDKPGAINQKPIGWIYGVEGMEGSVTSWLNNILSYSDLTNTIKERVNNLKVVCGYKRGNYSPSDCFSDNVNRNNPQNLVKMHPINNIGLFFPFNQVFDMDEELFNLLKKHVLQEKYMYHHHWKDNDILIGDQSVSLHKRHAFNGMETRVVHRTGMDYSKIYSL